MRILIATFLMSAILAPAHAADVAPEITPDIAIALTDDFIRVDTSFAGARITLFGAVLGLTDPAQTVDIISVVRGPDTHFQIRKIEQKNLIWMPRDAHQIESAPGLYLTNATKLISDIAPLPDQSAYHLGAKFLNVTVAQTPTTNHDDISPINMPNKADSHEQDFAQAFLDEIKARGLYHDIVGGVEFKKGGLFTINIDLPANTPVGEYSVSVYLYRNGVLLARDAADLMVNKVGIERQIYDLAHTKPVSYGIFCVALSLFSGWIASLAFRK